MAESAPSSGRRPAPAHWGLPAVVLALLLQPLALAWDLAPDLGHGWAAPLLMLFLWWERLDEAPWNRALAPAAPAHRRPGPAAWVGLGVLLLALAPLRLLLTPFPLWPTVLILHTALLAAALAWLGALRAGAAGARWWLAPLIVLLGTVPWPGAFERLIILPLREGIAVLVTEFSNLLGQPALASGTTLRLAGSWVGIDEACGGIRSLQAGVTVALFAGEWLRLRIGRRLALVLVAGTAALLGNLLRVSALVACAIAGDDVLTSWHDPLGWAALAFSLGLTASVARRWRRHASRAAPSRPPAAPIVSPVARPTTFALALAIVVGLGTLAFGNRLWFAPEPGRENAATATWLEVVLPEHQPGYRRNAISPYARDMLKPDFFDSGSWMGPDQVRRSSNVIEWHQGQAARSAPFIHNPAICLPFSGCELEETLGLVDVPWLDTTVPFQTYRFRYLDTILTVAFTVWDPSRGRPLEYRESGSRGTWLRNQWHVVTERRRDQPAQLIAYAIARSAKPAELIQELQHLLNPHPPRSSLQSPPSNPPSSS